MGESRPAQTASNALHRGTAVVGPNAATRLFQGVGDQTRNQEPGSGRSVRVNLIPNSHQLARPSSPTPHLEWMAHLSTLLPHRTSRLSRRGILASMISIAIMENSLRCHPPIKQPIHNSLSVFLPLHNPVHHSYIPLFTTLRPNHILVRISLTSIRQQAPTTRSHLSFRRHSQELPYKRTSLSCQSRGFREVSTTPISTPCR